MASCSVYTENDLQLLEEEALNLDVYCYCNGVETTEMIACDNQDCCVVWYHYDCVGLSANIIPEGEWYCRICSGAGNYMKEQGDNAVDVATSDTCDRSSCQVSLPRSKTSRKRTVKKVAAQSTFTLCNAKRESIKFLVLSSKTIMESPMLSLNRELEKELKPVLSAIVASEECPKTNKLATDLIELLYDSVNIENVSTDSFDKLCASFHVMRLGPSLPSLVRSYIKCRDFTLSNVALSFLTQFLGTEILKLVLQARINNVHHQSLDDMSSIQLSEEEEQVLRYVAGFIPYKLINFYARFKSNTCADVCLSTLASWKATSADSCYYYNFLNFSKEWIEKIDRGGLFKVNDDVYSFFRIVESVIKVHLNTHNARIYRDKSLRGKLLDEVQKSPSVTSRWYTLMQDVDDKIASSLFVRVLECYIDIRCRAYVNVFMYLKKKNDKKCKVSKKAEKSLRKQLRRQ